MNSHTPYPHNLMLIGSVMPINTLALFRTAAPRRIQVCHG